MKKIVSLLLVAIMLLCSVSAMAEIKMGQVEYAAHGTKCFAVLTVAVDGDTIVGAKITEYQVLPTEGNVSVPNAEAMFADSYAAGTALASKVVNNGYYSTNMTNHAGATLPLGVSYAAIEAFVTGKTISELETLLADATKESMVDAVAGCTLVDTLGYVSGLVAAAKAADDQTGYYTIYNKTGEAVTEVAVTVTATGEKIVLIENMAADAEPQVVTVTIDGSIDGHGALVFTFKTEGGYEASFDTLSIETAPITLLSADTAAGATAISFFAPAAE